ncbi:hypothetical protein BS78_04G200100 [Paspalum vaginatum]|nr:hypothetical protein BS78_04G200100 [Paspalum vaginatum]
MPPWPRQAIKTRVPTSQSEEPRSKPTTSCRCRLADRPATRARPPRLFPWRRSSPRWSSARRPWTPPRSSAPATRLVRPRPRRAPPRTARRRRRWRAAWSGSGRRRRRRQ